MTEMAKKLTLRFKGLLGATAILLLAPLPAFAHECSCTAPDHSCSTSVSCPGGCWAVCGTGGSCSSGCSGSPGGWKPENQGLKVDAPGKARPNGISLSARDLSSTALAEILSEHLGREVTFIPANPGESFNIDIGDMPPGELLLALSEFGAIATVGEGPNAAQGKSIQRVIPSASVSLKMDKTTAGEVAAILSQLLGGAPVRLETDNPYEPLSVDVSHMDLSSLVQGLQATSSIRAVLVEP